MICLSSSVRPHFWYISALVSVVQDKTITSPFFDA